MNAGHHLSFHAKQAPESAACIDARSGDVLSYAALDRDSKRFARLMRSIGLGVGDSLVILSENRAEFYALIWGAHRAGLYYTPVSWHSKATEIAYILENSAAKAFVASARFGDTARQAVHQLSSADCRCFSLGGIIEDFTSLESSMQKQQARALEKELSGREMLYTSGTTGNPKGVKFPLSDKPIDWAPDDDLFLHQDGYQQGAVVLAPGPLYHASPLLSTRAMHRFGGAVVVVDKFDPEETLKYIEQYRVTHMICVPTHFIRMLKLPDSVRARYDISSLQRIQHTGAPCPVDVKHAVIDWFGPIVLEYYGATERIGGAIITSEEWLAHPGSIGRPIGTAAHVLDEDTWEEVSVGETGVIYFEAGEDFSYHGDQKKTQSIRSPQGWVTLGDIGRVDAEGYLYLTDRKSNMIITGGVNVYPQEAENRLIVHPKVSDAAVFGIVHKEFGQEVKGVVQLTDPAAASPEMEQELIAFCREVLADVKCPRSIDFRATLPRRDNGKLYKKELIASYAGVLPQ